MEKAIRTHLVQVQVDPCFTESLFFKEAIKHMDTSPFSEAVQTTPFLKWFTVSDFKLYSGTINPVVHVQYYRRVMSLYPQGDALLCKVFLASLEERAIVLFQQLLHGNVSSIIDLFSVSLCIAITRAEEDWYSLQSCQALLRVIQPVCELVWVYI